MDVIENLEFDGYCKRTTALIGIFAALRILTSLLGEGLPFAARCFGALVGELSACAMITLYFNMTAHAFSEAMPEKGASRLYAFTEAISAVLKFCFVIEPLFPYNENALFVKFTALALDAFLSRLYAIPNVQKSSVCN